MKNVAIYPGTFDPITNGHLDILKKGTEIFDKVYLAVAQDTEKKTLFSLEKRAELCRLAAADIERVETVIFDGLVVDFAQKLGALAMIRGLRAVSDFEYELQLALMNKQLSRQINTVFLVPDYKHLYLSSSLIKQIVRLGGDLKEYLPSCVEESLKEVLRIT